MKRLLFIMVAIFALGMGSATAQNYIVVDSEKIFRSLEEYNQALATIDQLGTQEQQRVDEMYAQIEALYNSYMQVRQNLSATARTSREEEILERERQAQAYQESVFGAEGTLIQRRVELIQPIQKRVFETIERYATSIGADLVLDKASNPSLLYNAERVDKTQAIIEALKQQ